MRITLISFYYFFVDQIYTKLCRKTSKNVIEKKFKIKKFVFDNWRYVISSIIDIFAHVVPVRFVKTLDYKIYYGVCSRKCHLKQHFSVITFQIT